MKITYLLVVGLCVALASGYAIYDDEKEDTDAGDTPEEPVDDKPADNPAPSAKEGDAKAAAVPGNPAPTAEDVKAHANPDKAAKESPKEKAVTESNARSAEKDSKASTKSDIQSTTTNESEKEDSNESNDDDAAVDNQSKDGADDTAAHEEATDESKGEEQGESAENTAESAPESNGEPDAKDKSENTEESVKASDDEAPAAEDESKDAPEACNIKFKKVGCYKSTGKGQGFQTFIKSDSEAKQFAKKGKVNDANVFNQRLPEMVCDCANEALKAGNAVFSLKNIAECWTGPDDTIYDKEGPSDKCVTFDNHKCDPSSEICSGKKHSNFVYYIDTPEHTKSQEEVQQELAAERKKKARQAKKAAKSHKKENKEHKKHKKSKKKHSKA